MPNIGIGHAVHTATGICIVDTYATGEAGVGNANGRNVYGAAYADSREWCYSRGRSLRYEQRFASDLRGIKRAVGTMRLFRGVAHAKPLACGPPPTPPTVGDRYNLAGEIVLYLSETEAGVRLELQQKTGPKWVQEFDLPFDTLSIADFVNVGEREFINGAFL